MSPPTEPPSASPPVPGPLSSAPSSPFFLVEQRSLVERAILAMVLPGVAGAVNAAGFLAVGRFTSHVTGHVGHFGDELAQGRSDVAWVSLGMVGVFLAGAITATALVERAKRRSKARYVAPLVLQATVLAGYALYAAFQPVGATVALTALLCFAMGLQNALVTKISGAVIRTTHMTGIVTDIGIELVRLWTWLQALRLHNGVKMARALASGPEWKKLRLHGVVFASFLSGALVGPELFVHYGQKAMVGPCLILLLLAGFDFALGIQGAPESPQPENGDEDSLPPRPVAPKLELDRRS